MWEDWRFEFKLTPIELNVDEFINKLANYLSVPRSKSFDFNVFNVGKPKLLQVANHFVESFLSLAFEVLVINEDAKLLVLLKKS